jgi:hypothetical protein
MSPIWKKWLLCLALGCLACLAWLLWTGKQARTQTRATAASSYPQANSSQVAQLAHAEFSTNLTHEKVSHVSHEVSPDKFLKKLIDLPAGSERASKLMQFATIWAEQSPQEAAEAVLKLPAGDERNRLLGQIVAEWAKTNPAAAIDWLKIHEPENPDNTWLASQAYAMWAGQSGATAAKYAVSHDASTDSMKSILSSWSQAQPAEAYVFFENQLTASQRSQTAGSFLLAVAAVDPSVTQNLINFEAASTSNTPEQVASLAKNLARFSPESASNLANQIPDGDTKNALLEELKKPIVPTPTSVAGSDAPPETDVATGQDSTTTPQTGNNNFGLTQHKISP